MGYGLTGFDLEGWSTQDGNGYFVGSDGHRKTERIPEIGKCVAKMEKTMGSEYVKKIFIKNPRKITG